MACDSQPSAPAWLVEMVTSVLRSAPVRAALAEVMAEVGPAQGERRETLTSDELCDQLRISRSKLDTLVSAGLPHVKIGSARRFILAEALQWAREHDEKKVA